MMPRGHAFTHAPQVAQAQAAEGASAFAGIDAVGKCTVGQAVVIVFCHSVAAAAVAAYHSHHGVGNLWGASEQFSHLAGDLFTAGGALQPVHVTLFHEGFGHGAAARFSAAATVGAGQHFGYLVDKRVF